MRPQAPPINEAAVRVVCWIRDALPVHGHLSFARFSESGLCCDERVSSTKLLAYISYTSLAAGSVLVIVGVCTDGIIVPVLLAGTGLLAIGGIIYLARRALFGKANDAKKP